jgi:F0F1-type ATP synthase assembly protein I
MANRQQKQSNSLLWQYMGMAMQMMIAIGIFTYAGYQLDHYLTYHACFIIVFPILVIVVLLFKVIRDTNIKK